MTCWQVELSEAVARKADCPVIHTLCATCADRLRADLGYGFPTTHVALRRTGPARCYACHADPAPVIEHADAHGRY